MSARVQFTEKAAPAAPKAAGAPAVMQSVVTAPESAMVSRDGKTVVVLLCGGDKRSQDADIKRAKRYWKDYETRKRPAGRGTR